MWLAIFYWVHLLATTVWVGGLVFTALIALPAWRKNSLSENQWLDLQKRLLPYVNGAMALLWITGFVQMTNHPNYNGFLIIDSRWAVAISLKHVAAIALSAITLYIQFALFPNIERDQLLGQASTEQTTRFLWINLLLASIVLLFTAIASVS